MDKDSNIELIQGDITKLDVDAIVNAANAELRGGGGVDGAIHAAAGPELVQECRSIIEKQGSCPSGQAVITDSRNMKCGKIIHTVGPIWNGGNAGEETLLRYAYRNSLSLAAINGIASIAFPNISTGVYGFPKPRAGEIAIREVCNFFYQSKLISKVIFVCFDSENFEIYQEILSDNKYYV